MSVVVGIPLIKGNSQEIVPTRYDPANYPVTGKPDTGFGQSYVEGGIEPEIVPFGQGRFLGFAVEVGTCGNTCSVVRAGLAIPVKADDATNLTVGDQVYLNASGEVVPTDAVGAFPVNGTIEKIDGVTGINGKTGEIIDDIILINFGSGRTVNATPG